MMVPQHKAVRLQIVRRVDQLIHLTDRLVTGVRHLGLAKPEPFCCRCARQERERLRYGEADIDREQRFKLARRRSEERSGGKECVSTCRSRRSKSHSTTKKTDAIHLTITN